jgi:hypothetical protein
VYLAKTEDNKYEVIDGVQRLTSVFSFFEGKTSLSGLELHPELNKFHFKDLPESLQNKLQDATLRTFEVSQKTSKNLLFIIFKRLNTGGVALSVRIPPKAFTRSTRSRSLVPLEAVHWER